MKAYYKDLSQDIYKDHESGERIKGGYGVPDFNIVYIDENLPLKQQPLVIGHEVADLYFGKQIKHSRVDGFLIDFLDCLLQLGFEIKKI